MKHLEFKRHNQGSKKFPSYVWDCRGDFNKGMGLIRICKHGDKWQIRVFPKGQLVSGETFRGLYDTKKEASFDADFSFSRDANGSQAHFDSAYSFYKI